MKRLSCTMGLVCLLVVALCGTSHAVSVTLVRGSSALSSVPALSEKPIILAFGEDRVLIHDSRLPVKGKLLDTRDIPLTELFLVRDHRSLSQIAGYDTLYRHGAFRLAVVKRPEELGGLKSVRLWPVRRSMVVTRKAGGVKGEPDPKVNALIKRLNRSKYGEYMAMLARDLQTRYSCANEVLTARDKISREFKALGLRTNASMSFPNDCEGGCEEWKGFNVIGRKVGKVRPEEFYLVGAHYDSANGEGGACNTAPGACDNAGGVAAVMELVRVFRTVDTEASIVFVAFGGEEIDLLGSRKYVQELIDAGEDADLKAFVVLDMISFYKADATRGIIIEGSRGTARQARVLDRLVGYVKTYTDLDVEHTVKYSGSDHEPFLDEDMAGGLLIQMDCDAADYEPLHSARDTLGHQDLPFAIEVTKVAAALLAEAGIMDATP